MLRKERLSQWWLMWILILFIQPNIYNKNWPAKEGEESFSYIMVSVFEGQLARTWLYQLKDKTYTISLNHDTLSGVRMAMLNFEEINHSMGISSMIMDEVGHRIFFDIDGKSGYIEIKKSGWRAFSYQCFVNDESIPEQCTLPKDEPKEKFEVDISHVAFTPEEGRKTNVAWYVLNVKRLSDHVSTTVHR